MDLIKKTKIRKGHMKKVINEENDWDQMVESDVVEGPVEKVTRKEIFKAMQKMKSERQLDHLK